MTQEVSKAVLAIIRGTPGSFEADVLPVEDVQWLVMAAAEYERAADMLGLEQEAKQGRRMLNLLRAVLAP